jgi:putative membrane protein
MSEPIHLEKKPFSLFNGLKGLAIGMANIIPGVSGGSIAVITGIYDELVDAFGNFFRSQGGWRKNLFFLIPVVVGVLLGNVLFAQLVGFLLQNYPGPTNFGFIGLILGSAPYLIKKAGLTSFKWQYLVLFLVGLGLVLWMGLTPRPEASEPIVNLTVLSAVLIFIAAFVASIAMIIPGISGSFLLLLIGMYSTMQNGFSTFNIPVLLLFVVGTITGVVLVSKGISALLQKFHAGTYSMTIGLVLGSVVALYPGFGSANPVWMDVVGFVIGAGLSLLLGTSIKEKLLYKKN